MDGKVASVTGVGSGIGRASAEALAREGARVVAADVDAAGGEETIARIRAANADALFVRADVSVASEVATLVGRVVDAYGRAQQRMCPHIGNNLPQGTAAHGQRRRGGCARRAGQALR
jgi:NAD(P)-dependent dehydrogenase (short-subunit alcohol dehydrogenase family)